jgi:hypothetical protein
MFRKRCLPQNSFMNDSVLNNASFDNYCPCGCKRRRNFVYGTDRLTIPLAGYNPSKNVCPCCIYAIPGLPRNPYERYRETL